MSGDHSGENPTPAAAALEPSPWLTSTEAAARAKVGRKTLYLAVRNGKLKAARLAARAEMRFHVEWIDAWLTAAAADVVNPHAPGPHVIPRGLGR